MCSRVKFTYVPFAGWSRSLVYLLQAHTLEIVYSFLVWKESRVPGGTKHGEIVDSMCHPWLSIALLICLSTSVSYQCHRKHFSIAYTYFHLVFTLKYCKKKKILVTRKPSTSRFVVTIDRLCGIYFWKYLVLLLGTYGCVKAIKDYCRLERQRGQSMTAGSDYGLFKVCHHGDAWVCLGAVYTERLRYYVHWIIFQKCCCVIPWDHGLHSDGSILTYCTGSLMDLIGSHWLNRICQCVVLQLSSIHFNAAELQYHTQPIDKSGAVSEKFQWNFFFYVQMTEQKKSKQCEQSRNLAHLSLSVQCPGSGFVWQAVYMLHLH